MVDGGQDALESRRIEGVAGVERVPSPGVPDQGLTSSTVAPVRLRRDPISDANSRPDDPVIGPTGGDVRSEAPSGFPSAAVQVFGGNWVTRRFELHGTAAIQLTTGVDRSRPNQDSQHRQGTGRIANLELRAVRHQGVSNPWRRRAPAPSQCPRTVWCEVIRPK